MPSGCSPLPRSACRCPTALYGVALAWSGMGSSGVRHRTGLGWVSAGWAPAYRGYSMDYVDAENEARKARRGMWRGTFVKPRVWRASSPPERTQAPVLVMRAGGGGVFSAPERLLAVASTAVRRLVAE
jgi:hypothetical protein